MITQFAMKGYALFCMFALFAAFPACSRGSEPVIFGMEKRHFDRLKLGLRPALWEDDIHTTLDPGQYEWWYIDAHLDDGTVVVIAFYSRSMVGINSPAIPFVSVGITNPDGRRHGMVAQIRVEDFRASRDRFDVTIGKFRIMCDLKNYRILVNMKSFHCDLALAGKVSSWRPATGYGFYEKSKEKYFSWLAAVRYGRITGTMELKGTKRMVQGSGYHDHNWGNVELNKILNDWWWTRAQFGDYTVITSEMTTTERYGYKKVPVFMLARGDKILLEDSRKMTLARSGGQARSCTRSQARSWKTGPCSPMPTRSEKSRYAIPSIARGISWCSTCFGRCRPERRSRRALSACGLGANASWAIRASRWIWAAGRNSSNQRPCTNSCFWEGTSIANEAIYTRRRSSC